MKSSFASLIMIFLIAAVHADEFRPAEAGQAQQEALTRYPALGLAGSPMHREFMQRFEKYKAASAQVLTRPDWPLRLAEEASASLSTPDPQVAQTSAMRDRMNKTRSSLDPDSKPGTAVLNGTSKNLPAPLEGHTYTLTELNQQRAALKDQVVKVQLNYIGFEPEPAKKGYKIFVSDGAANGASLSNYAYVFFPEEGAEKMKLLGKTTRGSLSFYLQVSPQRFTAVGRSRNIDSFRNTFEYVW